ncbi:MAG: hypothetical protein K6G90_02895 [Clostridia bacterium]|nr:hypothetical protein [Clostridia bacterium]
MEDEIFSDENAEHAAEIADDTGADVITETAPIPEWGGSEADEGSSERPITSMPGPTGTGPCPAPAEKPKWSKKKKIIVIILIVLAALIIIAGILALIVYVIALAIIQTSTIIIQRVTEEIVTDLAEEFVRGLSDIRIFS